MDRNVDPNNLSLDEVVFLDNDYQFYLQEHNEENPRIYLEGEDNLDFMEDLPHDDDDDDGDHREVVEPPISRQSENDGEYGSINGVPMNTTGPRTPSHNEIHEKVTYCLKSSKNLLVECPTVLKRRFKILTGVLDYFQWKKNASNSKEPEQEASSTPSIIYFATRSIEESKVVLKEIKEHFTSSGHLSGLKISILDGRKNLCINEDVNSASEEEVDYSCLQMANNFNYNLQTASRGMNAEERPTCEYYCNARPREQLFSFLEENPDSNTIQDIEEFITNGQLNRQCPYFDSKQIHREAEFVICPQEFIISPLHRLDYDISLDKAIIIFDDGFDIENEFYNEGSIHVLLSEMHIFTQILRSITGQDIGKPDISSILEHMSTSIEALSRWIQAEILNDYKPKHGEIMEALRNHGFVLDNSTIENLVIFLGDIQTNPKVIIPTPTHVVTLRKFLFLITMASQNFEDFFMKVRKGGGDQETVLEILLTNPKVLFAPIGNNVLSIIIGATCIAPFETFNLEFGTPFQKVKYERDDEGLLNGHLFAYCSEGPTETSFELDYDSRDNPAVINEIGEAIIKICEKVQGGIIVVFHAESYFKNVLKEWRTHSVLIRLQNLKNIFSELDMTTPESTEVLLSNFRECCKSNPSPDSSQKSGAVLLVTPRGKVYHRLECLRGAEKRAIINVSVPYGAWGVDKLVIAKRFMFEKRHGILKPPENHDWYESEAFRKLNQSFSYSVQDKVWGIVVVFDKRMYSRRFKFDNLLPAWVKNRFRRNGFPQLMDAISKLVEAQEGNGN